MKKVKKPIRSVWVIIDKLNHRKRLRLPNGNLTPAFYSAYEAVKYYEDNNLFDGLIVRL